MKIKVSKTFQKVLALVLCTIMVFSVAPLANVLGLFTGANAEENKSITYTYYETVNGKSQLAQKTDKYAIGDEINKPANPVRIGYTFTGWYPEIPDTMPANDINTTAQWKINQYTITFDTDGGSTVNAITKDYDSAITAPAKPTKEGYTFSGWDKTVPSKMPAENMTITATWAINKHTLKFNTAGGSTVEDISGDFGTAVVPPVAPTKVGYDFIGWDKELPPTMPDKDMTFTAKWEPKTITLTFNTLGGSKIKEITAKYNTPVVTPENPTKEGYTFAGWLDENGEATIIPTIMPAENKTFTAKWTANTVEIMFDPNGGTVIHNGAPTQNPVPIPQTFDSTPVTPESPTKSGYTFMGWYDAKDTSSGTLLTDVPSTPKTYYAIWKEGTGKASYSITYHVMDVNGNYPTVNTVHYSAADGQLIDITNDVNAKITLGYMLDETRSPYSSLKATASVAEHYNFNVYIARKEYTITFNSDNGSELIKITDYYEAPVTAPKNPEKEGYVFKGWKNISTNAVENVPSFMPAADMSFIAHWETKGDTKYSVVINYKDVKNNNISATKKFDFTGSTGGAIKILIDGSASNDGTIYHNLSDFTLQHYKFDATAMAKQQLEGTIAADGSTVLNLYFAPAIYKVHFTVSGETVATEEIAYYTNASTVKPTTEFMNEVFAEKMPGYTFKGWDPELTNIEGETTYTATYTANIYSVVFDYAKAIIDDNGDIKPENEDFSPKVPVEPITQEFNTSVKLPAAPEKDGYECLCWYDSNFKTYAPGSTIKMPVNGLELKAYFIAKPYKVILNADLEGATLKTKSVTEVCDNFVEITEDMIPSKEGYTFLGWYDYSDAENPVVYNLGDFVLVPAHNVTLVAKWAVGEFAIIFKDNTDNGKIIATYEDIASDAAIKAPDYPKAANMKGRTFLGWREEGKKAGDPLYVFDKMPGHSMVLEAIWGYTITLEINTEDVNASLNSSKKIVNELGVETKLSEISKPTRTGYTFVGWFEDEEITEESTPVAKTVIYEKDVTLYADWTINSYSITLVADTTDGTGKFSNGSKRITISQDYNTSIVVPGNPTKTGYTFTGWKDQNGKSYNAVPTKMPAQNLVLTAQWTINQYSVIFKDPNGTVYKTEVLDYGTEIVAPENPSKIGHTFKGWDISVPATVPAHNVVVTAVWQANIYTITFVDTDGDIIDVVSATYGSSVRSVKEPKKCFYKFTGWDKEVPSTMPAEDMIITATWARSTVISDFFSSFFMSFFSFLNQILGFINGSLS